MDVPALTINKVCLSGIDAIALADQLIRAGEFDVVVAGGMESMTNAPHLLVGSREGVKYGNWQMLDSMAFDALFCAFDECAMGERTEKLQRALRPSPARSRTRSAPAPTSVLLRPQDGEFAEEIAPVADPAAQGRPRHGHGRRGRSRRHDGRVAVEAAPGLRQGRHDHGGQRLADLRRGRCGRRHEQGEGAGARPRPGSPRSAPTASCRARTRPCRSSRRTPSSRPARARASPSPTSTSFELNEAFAAVGIVSTRELGVERRHRQRQRRRHRPRPPGRHVGRPASCCTSRSS